MTIAEYEALDTDHPEWIELTNDQIRERYWAYDITVVRLARAEAHRRRLLELVAGPPVRRLAKRLRCRNEPGGL